jgi:hypothetical protein
MVPSEWHPNSDQEKPLATQLRFRTLKFTHKVWQLPQIFATVW